MYVMYRYELRGSLHVVSKQSWDGYYEAFPTDKNYTKIAEHENIDVLISMARLANKGEPTNVRS